MRTSTVRFATTADLQSKTTGDMLRVHVKFKMAIITMGGAKFFCTTDFDDGRDATCFTSTRIFAIQTNTRGSASGRSRRNGGGAPKHEASLLKEYPKEKFQDSMDKEMPLMTDFDVAHPVPAESISPVQRASAMGFTWAHQWTCSDVRSRLCVRGFTQMIKDLDTTSASTRVLLSLQLLLTPALAFDRSVYTLDICIAVLHATLNPSDGPIYVWHPEEYLPHKNVPWRLTRALCGSNTPRE